MAESYVIVRAMLIGKIRLLDPGFTLRDSQGYSNAGLKSVLTELERQAKERPESEGSVLG